MVLVAAGIFQYVPPKSRPTRKPSSARLTRFAQHWDQVVADAKKEVPSLGGAATCRYRCLYMRLAQMIWIKLRLRKRSPCPSPKSIPSRSITCRSGNPFILASQQKNLATYKKR